MARARRLLWLGALAGIVYIVWRWRNQQISEPGLFPGPLTPSDPAPLPPPQPHESLAPPEAPQAAPRRVPTRVHRGAPPAPLAPTEAAQPDAEQPPEPAAPAAATVFRELEVGASAPVDVEPPAAEARQAAEDEVEQAAEPLEGDEAPAERATLASGGASEGDAGLPLNLNTADLDALIALPGIGPTLARRIIAYREQHGPLTSVEQLVDIQGIGTRNIDDFRHLVTV